MTPENTQKPSDEEIEAAKKRHEKYVQEVRDKYHEDMTQHYREMCRERGLNGDGLDFHGLQTILKAWAEGCVGEGSFTPEKDYRSTSVPYLNYILTLAHRKK